MSETALSSEPVVDAYRDSFKYFKSYSGTSSTPSSSKRRRTSGKRSVGGNVELRDNGSGTSNGNYSKYESKYSNSSCSFENNDDEGGESGSRGWSLACRGILLPYPKASGDNGESRQEREKVFQRETEYSEDCQCYKLWGLRKPDTWTVVELAFPQGLIVIKNPFTSGGQRYWITRALLDFPHHAEYITNMDNLNRLEKMKRGDVVDDIKNFKLDTSCKEFYEKLRWVTFGYHHDWDTKIYSEKMRSDFPADLADMTRYISQVLRFSDFEAEAAIANYYHMDSTLSGHVDRSEVNQPAPLFSLSFGQSAIFLIGGKTKAEIPQPVLLQSGDIAIMSGESRLSYHGVPKILPSKSEPWSFECTLENDSTLIDKGQNFVKRQKLDESECTHLPFHNCVSFNATLKDPCVFNKMNETNWTDFVKDYIQKSRINLNIRQVLFPGQSCLTL